MAEEEKKKNIIWLTEEDFETTKISINPKEETIIIIYHEDMDFSE